MTLGQTSPRRALRAARLLLAQRDAGGMALLAALCSVTALNRGLMWLEDRLIPELETLPLDDVVFVLGHHRSGTTNVHKALRQHPDLRCGTFYDVLFPSLIAKKLFRTRPARWIRGMLDRSAQERYDTDNHAISLDEEMEEHLWLLHRLRSEAFLLMFPSLLLAEPGLMSDCVEVSDEDLRFTLRCLRRMVHGAAPGTTYVARPLIFTMHAEALLRHVPDARVILCVREPSAAIRSHGAMTQAQLGCAADDPRLLAWAEDVYRCVSGRQYAAMLDLLRDPAHAGRVWGFAFADIQRDTPAVLRRMLDVLGLPAVELPPARSERHAGKAPDLIAPERIEADLGELYRRIVPLLQRCGDA